MVCFPSDFDCKVVILFRFAQGLWSFSFVVVDKLRFYRTLHSSTCSLEKMKLKPTVSRRYFGNPKLNRCRKRGAIRRKCGTEKENSRVPTHSFPCFFSNLCRRHMCRVRHRAFSRAPIACTSTHASAGFCFLCSLLHLGATLCCE